MFKVFLFIFLYIFLFRTHKQLQYIIFTIHYNNWILILPYIEKGNCYRLQKGKKKRFKKKKKDKVHKNTIVYILTIKRRLPVFKVFLISLRPGVVCYAHLYISHFPLYTLFTHTPQPPPPPPLLICNVQRTFRICLSGYTDREESEDEKRRKEWWTPRSLPILRLFL